MQSALRRSDVTLPLKSLLATVDHCWKMGVNSDHRPLFTGARFRPGALLAEANG
jgi:hypothetical protein